MDVPRCSILFGNEPRLYREAFAAAVTELRPQIEVMAVAPSDVEATLWRRRPCLLVCSRLTAAMQAMDIDWVVIPPDDSEPALVRSGGVSVSRSDFSLDDLLAALDRAAARSGAPSAP